MSDLAKKLRELLSETEKEKMSGAGVILTLSELTVILAALEENADLRRDAEIGQQWRENSSLEKWFPFTAEELSDLRRKLEEAEQRHAAVMLHTQTIVDEANALRTRAEEAERKLADAHDMVRRKAAEILKNLRTDAIISKYVNPSDCLVARSELAHAREAILTRLNQPVKGQK